jgi:sugar transferase (PEP-CTERM system associated)
MVRIFKHYIPKTLLLLGVIETLILVFAMYVAASASVLLNPAPEAGAILPKALLFAFVMVAAMTMLGLYQRQFTAGQWGLFPRLAVSFLIGLALLTVFFYAIPGLYIGNSVFAAGFLTAAGGITAARYIYVKTADQEAAKRRVLVLGAGSRALRVGEVAKTNGFEVLGYVPFGGTTAAASRILSSNTSLLTLVQYHRPDEIVVAVRNRRAVLPVLDLLACKVKGVEVVDLPAFLERETGRIELETVNPSWLVFSDGFAQGKAKTRVKRAFDVVMSVALLVCASPIMALTALLIYLEDRGPILYRQERVGHERNFMLFKFRSMRVDAERDGVPQWARKNDDRVTRVGNFIRKVRIDELPQAFNVLRGDMSFVGPRPERPYFVEQIARIVPYYGYRHTVKPGITGWAQVRYPYGASVEDAVQKLQYDLYYVKNHSLFLDVIILFQTARVLFWRDGAR